MLCNMTGTVLLPHLSIMYIPVTTSPGGRVPSLESIRTVEQKSCPAVNVILVAGFYHQSLKGVNYLGPVSLMGSSYPITSMGLLATSVLTAETQAAAIHSKVLFLMQAHGVAN